MIASAALSDQSTAQASSVQRVDKTWINPSAQFQRTGSCKVPERSSSAKRIEPQIRQEARRQYRRQPACDHGAPASSTSTDSYAQREQPSYSPQNGSSWRTPDPNWQVREFHSPSLHQRGNRRPQLRDPLAGLAAGHHHVRMRRRMRTCQSPHLLQLPRQCLRLHPSVLVSTSWNVTAARSSNSITRSSAWLQLDPRIQQQHHAPQRRTAAQVVEHQALPIGLHVLRRAHSRSRAYPPASAARRGRRN